MDAFLKLSVEGYLKNLSGRSMVPGGGSASALTASLGTSLNLMVINYSFKKDLSGEKKTELMLIRKHQEKSLKRLSYLIDEDCRVFQKLMDKLSSKSEAQSEYIAAAKVPIEVCVETHASMAVSESLLRYTNKNLIADIGCAGHILKAAFYSAELNVDVNLKHVKDRFFVENSKKILNTMRKEIELKHKKIQVSLK